MSEFWLCMTILEAVMAMACAFVGGLLLGTRAKELRAIGWVNVAFALWNFGAVLVRVFEAAK